MSHEPYFGKSAAILSLLEWVELFRSGCLRLLLERRVPLENLSEQEGFNSAINRAPGLIPSGEADFLICELRESEEAIGASADPDGWVDVRDVMVVRPLTERAGRLLQPHVVRYFGKLAEAIYEERWSEWQQQAVVWCAEWQAKALLRAVRVVELDPEANLDTWAFSALKHARRPVSFKGDSLQLKHGWGWALTFAILKEENEGRPDAPGENWDRLKQFVKKRQEQLIDVPIFKDPSCIELLEELERKYVSSFKFPNSLRLLVLALHYGHFAESEKYPAPEVLAADISSTLTAGMNECDQNKMIALALWAIAHRFPAQYLANVRYVLRPDWYPAVDSERIKREFGSFVLKAPEPPATAESPAQPVAAESGEPPAAPEPGEAPAAPEPGDAPAAPESGEPPAAPESGEPPAVPEPGEALAVPEPGEQVHAPEESADRTSQDGAPGGCSDPDKQSTSPPVTAEGCEQDPPSGDPAASDDSKVAGAAANTSADGQSAGGTDKERERDQEPFGLTPRDSGAKPQKHSGRKKNGSPRK